MAVRLPRLDATAPSPGFLQTQWQKLCRLIEEAFAERDTTLAQHGSQIGALELGYSVVSKSATYTEETASGTLLIKASGTFTINLPSATTSTTRFIVKLVSAGTVTIDPAGSETIDGAATLTINTLWQARTFVSDGANWLTI